MKNKRKRPDAVSLGYECPECKGQFSIKMQIVPQGPPVFAPPHYRCAMCPGFPILNQTMPEVADVSPIIVPTTAPTLRAVKPNGGM